MKRDRDTLSMVLGIIVLILGIVLVVVSVYSFISLATNPSSFFHQQGGQVIPLVAQAGGPTAAFSWQTSGYTLSVQDQSQSGGAAIVNWRWSAGDGRGVGYGQTISPYTYAQAGSYTISLTVQDANLNTNSVQTQIQIPSNASGSAGPVNGGGNPGGNGTSGCTGSNCGGSLGSTSLLTAAAVILTVTMHVVMGFTGVLMIKAGYGLLRPRGATITVPMRA